MRIAALVVSYNRRELLAKCLDALLAQTFPLTEIVVVDNNSNDGSVEMLRASYRSVTVLHTQQNIGGAGGFTAGIEYLIHRQFDFAWLMDDDAEPKIDALNPLVEAMRADTPAQAPGFVASRVCSFDGSMVPPSVYPPPHPAIPTKFSESPPGTVPVGYAIFVGVLINLHISKQTFLPVREFFLLWDDTEYTARLQRIAGGFYCENSVVWHPAKPELKDLKSRLRLDIRNRIWILRDKRLGSATATAKAGGLFWNRVVTQARNAESKRRYAHNLVLGVFEGCTKRPTLKMPTIPSTTDVD